MCNHFKAFKRIELFAVFAFACLILNSAIAIDLVYLDNIDALRSYNGTATRVKVRGYHSADDGAGLPTFYYVADGYGNANDGTIIGHSNGQSSWHMDYSGPINVRWFGAVPFKEGAPSSRSVNTIAFNKAFELEKDVIINDVYEVGVVQIIKKNNITVSGGGTIRGQLGIIGIANGWIKENFSYNVKIKDITIDGEGAEYCLLLQASWLTNINNVYFTNADIGIKIGCSLKDNISNCKFENFSSAWIKQATDDKSADITIANNTFIRSKEGIVLTRMDGLNISGNIFFGTAEPATKNHIFITNNNYTTTNWFRIVNNTFFEVGNATSGDNSSQQILDMETSGAIFINGNCFQQGIISNNHFGWCYNPIHIIGTRDLDDLRRNGDLIVSNNRIEQSEDLRGNCHSIFMSSAGRNVKIVDNSIWRTGGNTSNIYDAIHIETVEAADISRNLVLNEEGTPNRHGIYVSKPKAVSICDNMLYRSASAPVWCNEPDFQSVVQRNNISDYTYGGQSTFLKREAVKRTETYGSQGDIVEVQKKEKNGASRYYILTSSSDLVADDQVGEYLDARNILVTISRFHGSTVYGYSEELGVSAVELTRIGVGKYTLETSKHMYNGLFVSSAFVGPGPTLRYNRTKVISDSATNCGSAVSQIDIEIVDSNGVPTDLPELSSLKIFFKAWMRL